MTTRPAVAVSSPDRIRSAVVFPDPEAPSSTRNSPGATSRSNCSSTFTGPKYFWTLSNLTGTFGLPAGIPYPFTAPIRTPLEMNRVSRIAIRITGMIMITMTALISHHSTPFSPAFFAATMIGMVCTLA
jgi:hypothetical protein